MRAHQISPAFATAKEERDGDLSMGRVKFLRARVQSTKDAIIGPRERPVKSRPAVKAALSYRKHRAVSYAR